MDTRTKRLHAVERRLGKVEGQSRAPSKQNWRLTNMNKRSKDTGPLRLLVVALLGVGLALTGTAVAAILSLEKTEIVFEKDKVPEGVAWSPTFTLTEDGLFSPQPELNTSYEVWIQTQKIPAGLSWRPPHSTRLTLSVYGVAPNGFPLDAYVRYGCDGVHWSTWYWMPAGEKPAEGALNTYACELRLPQAARESYEALMAAWRETDPDWACDEDALCRWLVKKRPEFFAQEFPFIGYVQFRLEHSGLHEQVKVKSLSAQMSWGVGGRATVPKSGRRPPTHEKWRFDLGEAQ